MDTKKDIMKRTGELVQCLLKESIGETCCIFRAPPNLLQNNPLEFRPNIVSIGPYHNNNDERLQMIEKHKLQFLELFMETSNQQGRPISMTSLENVVGDLEENIRGSYSEALPLTREELVKMMVLDGCFVLMLILVVSKRVRLTNPNDKILTLPWVVPTLRRDLLLLENQVPYTLLETLFGKLGFPSYVELKRLICIFFESSSGYMSQSVLENANKIQPGHLLHLIRETLIPASCYKIREGGYSGKANPELIVSAKNLQLQGIKFETNKSAETILEIGLEENTLSIPPMILDKFMATVLLNITSFEQCSRICEDDITSYVMFMGFLMQDKEDVLFIIKEKIIENCFGTNEEVSCFFQNVNKGVHFRLYKSYLSPVFEGLNAYTSKRLTGYRADFKHNNTNPPLKRN